MKEETKEEIKENTQAFLGFLAAHPALRGGLIGFVIGLLVCWAF